MKYGTLENGIMKPAPRAIRIGGAVDGLRDFYGMKCFPWCLSDDELRNVRDLDMFEMQRRGMTRWRAQ